ncbi:hypothetical protein V6N13_074528 [Hibiscus sabdariffa]
MVESTFVKEIYRATANRRINRKVRDVSDSPISPKTHVKNLVNEERQIMLVGKESNASEEKRPDYTRSEVNSFPTSDMPCNLMNS